MRLWTRLAATTAFAGAALLGGSAGADGTGFLAFEKVGENQSVIWFRADVGPDCEGAPLTVRFGPQFDTGPVIGGTVVHTGQNYFAVPNQHAPGWYTARVKNEVRGIDGWAPGEN